MVESGRAPLSSEASYRFLFAWELGRSLGFGGEYRFDFEWPAYLGLDADDRFLDLLVYTDEDFKVAFEFKLPKRSEARSPSASTQIRAKICRDISRLGYLVRNKINSVRLGYFLCATDEGGYLSEGRKNRNVQYATYDGKSYAAGYVCAPGEGRNGIPRSLEFPSHEVRFEWEGIQQAGVLGQRLVPAGRFAWLKPIRVAG